MNIGILIALSSGIALGSITSFASLSYQLGGTVPDLLVLRGVMALLAVGLYCLVMKERLLPRRRSIGISVMIGVALTVVGLGYMGSVYFISPGLAVAILYIYPVMVLAVDSITTRQRPDGITVFAFAIALVGIVFSVGIEDTSLDWRGVALALASAGGMAATLCLTSAANRHHHGFGVLLPAQAITLVAALVLVATLRGGGPLVMLPESALGMVAMAAAAGLYSLGILLSFIALRFAPASLVALMMNIEPVTTLMAARLLVDEQLTLLQYGGILLAVTGIAIGGLMRAQKIRP